MTQEPVKYREFWIKGCSSDLEYAEIMVSNKDPKILSDDDDYMDMKSRENFHVIEYPALLAEREKSKKLLEGLKNIGQEIYYPWTGAIARQLIKDYENT